MPCDICTSKEPAARHFIATKRPRVTREQPINAAQIAQLDLLQAAAEFEPPETDIAAIQFVMKIGYWMMPAIDMRDVAPADAVLRCEAAMDDMIQDVRPGVEEAIQDSDPPIFKETHDRLIRGGQSAEEATEMICRSIVIELIRQTCKEKDAESIVRALSRLPRFPDDR